MHHFDAGNCPLKHCRPDLHRAGDWNQRKCSNKHYLSTVYDMYSNFPVARNRKCDQCLPEAWRKRGGRSCQLRWLWYLPDDDLRTYLIRIYLHPAYTHAEILRCNSGSSSLCTGIYPHCCDWISISDCKHWYEQADPRRRKSALFNDFHADRCHCKYDS